MSRILSITELEGMIEAIKKDNPHYDKKVKKCACGIFNLDKALIEHRHIGIKRYKQIEY